MPSKIHILDDATINQIAAGEVVENSASVVKELIENSIDAGSTRITVEIKGGGRHLIRITDNGEGMNKEDALLSFERHATSKLKKIDDFDQLNTMGFRGEALASIASVSKIKLTTQHKEENEGVLLEIAAGKQLNISTIPCDKGTIFEVSDLFFNTPARKKFLKSPQHDLQEIQKALLSLIFGNPAIDFDLITDGKRVWEIPLQTGNDFFSQLKQRIAHLLHPEIADALLPIDFNNEAVSIKGYIGQPEIHRPNRSSQYLFLNRRPIQSWLISQAVAEGYGTAIPERRHPVFVLHFTIDPKEFDVNVHPQKKEVRFRHEQRLKKIISDAIVSCFGILKRVKFSSLDMPVEMSYPIHTSTPVFRETQEEFAYQRAQELSFPMTAGLFGKQAVFLESPHLFPRRQGLFLMHLERAFNRIYHEKSMAKEKSQEKQLLLIPLTLTLDPHESNHLRNNLELFGKLGFEIHEFAHLNWMIRAVPLGFKEIDLLDFIRECLQEEGMSLPQKTAKYLSSKVSRFEVDAILRSLFTCQQPLFSSKGETIFREINEEDFL